jgi:hypothetical protein
MITLKTLLIALWILLTPSHPTQHHKPEPIKIHT